MYRDDGYDEMRDNPHGYSVDDDGLMALTRSIQDVNAAHKREAHVAYAVAARATRRQWNPNQYERHLDALAFIAGLYRGLPSFIAPFMTETQQYIAAFEALKQVRGRFPAPFEREDLRRASRAAWIATHPIPLEAAPQRAVA